MSSPCLSGGSRAYGFDLEIVKSPYSSTRTSQTSSPSSTLSESSNSPLAISTRKPRTPRKRPNQIYNEAAALLSTAYPNIFSTKHLSNPRKFTKPHQDTLLLDESLSSSELLWPFRAPDDDRSRFLLRQNKRPSSLNESKVSNLMSCSDSQGNSVEFCDGYDEDFDAESILDEEIEEGIDSIMGNLSVSLENVEDESKKDVNSWYLNSIEYNNHLGGYGNGLRKALKHKNEANLWTFPIVDMLQISPRLSNSSKKVTSEFYSNAKLKKLNSGEKKKKKVEKPPATAVEMKKEISSPPPSSSGLQLKLNYDSVLNAWSDRGSPFSEGGSASDGGNDVSARIAQIDLFSENGGIREASVMRYKEKRRTRLFSKKIRYQVRKVNADQRPRMKGRFVRRPSTTTSSSKRREK